MKRPAIAGRFFYVCDMTNSTFLHKLAIQLCNQYPTDLHRLCIILPNKRAKIFLESAFKEVIQENIFCPTILSIEELLFQITQINSIDSVELLFEFYDVYIQNTPLEHQQSFDQFSGWAPVLLQDFNEIDRYLLNPKSVLSYLKEIEDIKHWSVDVDKQTPLIANYLIFYNRLIVYYESLYRHLLANQLGYQGLIYREAIRLLPQFNSDKKTKYIFAGFNALNVAEEQIFQYLLNEKDAEVYWDVDQSFVNDPYHEAGLFARRYLSWPYYKQHYFEWMVDAFSEPKNISIIGTPKSVGQAKIIGQILQDLPKETIQKTAIVLGDENLLSPLIYSLPNNIDEVNITMGMTAKNNPVQVFFNKLFRLHLNAVSKSGYVFYYKDLLAVLNHPMLSGILEVSVLVQEIKKRNITFLSYQQLVVLSEDLNKNDFFELLVSPWPANALDVIGIQLNIIHVLKEALHTKEASNRLTRVFLFAIHQVFNKLKNYFIAYPTITHLEYLFSLYKQAVQLAEVSFEGQPLGGLQIMGLLESRVLDFENVIITSLNEGTLPSGKSALSFIPYDVKMELGLPTTKEKDAIYTYHFYHLLMRAKNVYLLYNTEPDGLDAGEKSRYITQLLIEKKQNHQTTAQIIAPQIPTHPHVAIQIPKTEQVIVLLKEMALKGFSPTGLTSYLRNPMLFYYQRILKLGQVEEVEESIAMNTFGNVIHQSLEVLYRPYIGVYLTLEDTKEMKSRVEQVVHQQFSKEYSDGVIRGKNLIAYKVARQQVLNMLKLEEKWLNQPETNTVKIIALEQRFECVLEGSPLPFQVVLGGNIDRIEERNGIVRIIDYKTGKVEPKDLVVKDWNQLLDVKYEKAIQLLAYCLMTQKNHENQKVETGIICFKNMTKEFMPLLIKTSAETTLINPEILQDYTRKIMELIAEILNSTIPFSEKRN